MKDGTSNMTFAGKGARIRSCNRLSLMTLSNTRPPVAGQTLTTVSSNCVASSTASGRSGNTVNRVAVTARLRSMYGE